jgi:sulfhydrogenase subunit beta (sulfur reductase)
MMKVIEKEKLASLLDSWIEERKVYAPVERRGVIVFEEIESLGEARLEFSNTRVPPKSVYYPQREVLFTTTGKEGDVELKAPASLEETVIFGVRPCDAHAVTLLDAFFGSGEHKDISYLSRREKITLVGLACNDPAGTCFCTSVGGDPHGRQGLDAILVDLGDRYLIEAMTERGQRLLDGSDLMRDAVERDLREAKELRKRAEAQIDKLELDELDERLDGLFEDPLWEEMQRKCMGCGVCTFTCPTCWCFDMADEEVPEGTERIRFWDTCQAALFTKQGSGFNPRPSGKERMRQRVMHKFNYYPKDFGRPACVGCGRCVTSCPVNQDIREVLVKLMGLERGEADE